MNNLAQKSFDLLYTRFAWAYDTVADIVSLGEWQEWAEMATVFIPDGARVLELAHGPGHLHAELRSRGRDAVALDLSPQMNALAAKAPSARVVQASAAHLPFGDGAFGCLVSTFPTSFIYQKETLAEMWRVLAAGGRAVIIPGARLIHNDPLSRLIRLAYRITGQGDGNNTFEDFAQRRFEEAGFSFWKRRMGTNHAAVTVWVLKT